MAVVSRYFSTSGAGAADGTSWANRAALFSAGNWSSIITGFAFNASDSLECLVEGAQTYTCAQLLDAALFSNAPTGPNPLIFRVCDSSGAKVLHPSPGWTSDQPVWSDAAMPIIATTSNIVTVWLGHSMFVLFKFTASGANGVAVGFTTLVDCIVINSTSHASATCFAASGAKAINCWLQVTGTAYSAVGNTGLQAYNTRLQGNPSASSGNRQGIGNSGSVQRCTIVGNPGTALIAFTGGGMPTDSVITNNGGNALHLQSGSNQGYAFTRCMITGNGGYGIIVVSGNSIGVRNRLRNNTSGNFNAGNISTDFGTNISAGTDADEYVNAAGGDYRIKAGSAIHGLGYGVSDEPAAGGGGSSEHSHVFAA